MRNHPSISIIIPVKNEGELIRETIDSAFNVKTICSFEIVVVDDASEDNCCDFLRESKRKRVRLITTRGVGAANARNVGAKHAKGDILIFCDAHLVFEDYWIEKLVMLIISGQADAVSPAIASSDNPEAIGYGMSLNENFEVIWNGEREEVFETAILPGGCLAIKKETFSNVLGFETGFKIWGFEDVELSIKLWLFGYTCMIVPTIKIVHVFRESHPYTVDHKSVDFNLLWMAYKHFSDERIDKCKELIKFSNSNEIEQIALESNVLDYRKAYFNSRVYDDNWFFHKFSINF